MEAKNPYRSNEFCVNWEDNLLATSMGDAFEVGKQAGIREVVEFANHFAGIKHNPEWKAQLKEWGL